jgi:hypothetical protein
MPKLKKKPRQEFFLLKNAFSENLHFGPGCGKAFTCGFNQICIDNATAPEVRRSTTRIVAVATAATTMSHCLFFHYRASAALTLGSPQSWMMWTCLVPASRLTTSSTRTARPAA